MSNVSGLFRRGTTYNLGTTKTLDTSYGTSVGIEGHIAEFTDEVAPIWPAASVTAATKMTKRSDRKQMCIVVRNVSAGALLPGRLVSWASGYVGKRVDGYTTTTNARVAGVVDERLPAAGVPRYDLFWLQVKGPCLVKNAVSSVADIAEGDYLVALTAATSGATTAGYPQKMVIASTNAVTVSEQLLGKFGRALSARLSNVTTAFLVDLETM